MILLHQGWVRAPRTPLGSPMAHIELVASLLDTLLEALLTNVEALPRKKYFRHISLHFLAMYPDICTGKETMKGVFQAAKTS